MDPRLAAHILVVAGTLTDDEDFRIRIAAVDDDVRARLAARAFLAVVAAQALAEIPVRWCGEDVVVRGAEEIELYRQAARFTPVAVPGR